MYIYLLYSLLVIQKPTVSISKGILSTPVAKSLLQSIPSSKQHPQFSTIIPPRPQFFNNTLPPINVNPSIHLSSPPPPYPPLHPSPPTKPNPSPPHLTTYHKSSDHTPKPTPLNLPLHLPLPPSFPLPYPTSPLPLTSPYRQSAPIPQPSVRNYGFKMVENG